MINNNPRVVFVARHAVWPHLDPGRLENLSSCLCSSGCSGTFFVVVVCVCVLVTEHIVFCRSCTVHGVVCCDLEMCLSRWFASSGVHVNDRVQGFPSRMWNRGDPADIVPLKNARGEFKSSL